ncbi:MAG: hypothetical protein ACXWL2_01480 [Candidatus Chromulinivorax sp.]
MKKQILYFTILLQATNITLSFDPLSIGLFAGAVSLFSARQRALDQNKNTTVYQYNPNEIKFKHPQAIIIEQLDNNDFCDQNGQVTQKVKDLTDSNFTKNPEFLENLKKSKAGLKYYNDNAFLLSKNEHKIDSSTKDAWWATQIESSINYVKENVTIDENKKAFGQAMQNLNRPKALSLNQDTNETSINSDQILSESKDYLPYYQQIYEKHKNAPNPWLVTTEEFSKIVTYTPVETKFIQIAILDKTKQVPLTEAISAYRQFPWLARFKKPESFSNETTAYSKAQHIFKEQE